MDKYNIINILDLVDNIGEQEVNNSISSFRCDKNKEIEEFINNNAIDFAKPWNHCNYKKHIKYMVICIGLVERPWST